MLYVDRNAFQNMALVHVCVFETRLQPSEREPHVSFVFVIPRLAILAGVWSIAGNTIYLVAFYVCLSALRSCVCVWGGCKFLYNRFEQSHTADVTY